MAFGFDIIVFGTVFLLSFPHSSVHDGPPWRGLDQNTMPPKSLTVTTTIEISSLCFKADKGKTTLLIFIAERILQRVCFHALPGLSLRRTTKATPSFDDQLAPSHPPPSRHGHDCSQEYDCSTPDLSPQILSPGLVNDRTSGRRPC